MSCSPNKPVKTRRTSLIGLTFLAVLACPPVILVAFAAAALFLRYLT